MTKPIKIDSLSFRVNNKSTTFFSCLKEVGLLKEKDHIYHTKYTLNDYCAFKPTDPRVSILKRQQMYKVPEEQPPFFYEISVNGVGVAELDWEESIQDGRFSWHIKMIACYPWILIKALANETVDVTPIITFGLDSQELPLAEMPI